MALQLEAVYEHGILRPLEPLVLAEHQHVRLTIEERTAPVIGESAGPVNERREELQWLATESGPYAGEWVALNGPSLVAHDEKLAAVRASARAAGVPEPFFARVPRDPHLPSGGWQGMHRLEFERRYDYSGEDESIVIPVALRCGSSEVQVAASLDTGASFCIFGAEIAEALGLRLTSGIRQRFRTANSSFDAYGHGVEIHAFGFATHSFIYFFADPMIDRNVLGRTGWLDRVRLGLVHHDSKIYLAPYETAWQVRWIESFGLGDPALRAD